LELEASLVVVVCGEELVVVVRGVAGVDSVGSVDDLEVVETPVVALLDVKDTAFLVGKRDV
jgi:hypothetical protein